MTHSSRVTQRRTTVLINNDWKKNIYIWPLTPGMAHSPQSFLLIDTNCRIGCLETEWFTFAPLASTFHLPNHATHQAFIKKKTTTFHGFILYVNKRSNYLWLASIWIIPLHNVKKELPGDNGICCVIGSPSSEQTSTCHPCASTGISKRVKGNLIQF